MNIVLRAVWGNYVIFEAGVAGAAGAMDTLTVPTGSVYELPPCDYSAACRVFREWSVVIGEGAEQIGNPEDRITVTADTVVTAMWDNVPFGEANFILPANAKTIEANAFENAVSITAVDASHCESIGDEAFRGCTMLTRIRLPKDCRIADTAFDGCTSLAAIYGQAGGTAQAWAQAHRIAFIEE